MLLSIQHPSFNINFWHPTSIIPVQFIFVNFPFNKVMSNIVDTKKPHLNCTMLFLLLIEWHIYSNPTKSLAQIMCLVPYLSQSTPHVQMTWWFMYIYIYYLFYLCFYCIFSKLLRAFRQIMPFGNFTCKDCKVSASNTTHWPFHCLRIQFVHNLNAVSKHELVELWSSLFYSEFLHSLELWHYIL